MPILSTMHNVREKLKQVSLSYNGLNIMLDQLQNQSLSRPVFESGMDVIIVQNLCVQIHFFLIYSSMNCIFAVNGIVFASFSCNFFNDRSMTKKIKSISFFSHLVEIIRVKLEKKRIDILKKKEIK